MRRKKARVGTLGDEAESLEAVPSVADEVLRRIELIRAGKRKFAPAYKATLRERVFLMSKTQKTAAAVLVAVALAATAWAAEKAVQFVLEGRPVKIRVKSPPKTTTLPGADGNTMIMTGTVESESAVEVTTEGGTGPFTREQWTELDKLIAAEKYKLLGKAETPAGTKCTYRFTFSDGATKDWPFFMPLDGIKSLADYNKKYQQYDAARQAAMRKAMIAGRYRLINVEPILEHLCVDVASGKEIRVLQIRMPDGSEIASARFAEPVTAPRRFPSEETQYETSWQEHLDLIKSGKRKLIDARVLKSYWYEVTLDDGSKAILGIGGQNPLGKPAARSVPSTCSGQASSGQATQPATQPTQPAAPTRQAKLD
jgi:hypothetical protein